MRILLLVALFASLAGSTGCMVLDEIDNANAKLSGMGEPKQDEKAAATTNAPTRKSALLEESKEWWGRATSLSTEKVDSGIVKCMLRGGDQFMSKNDCLARGGTARRI